MLELVKTRLGTAICTRRIPTSAHFHVQYIAQYIWTNQTMLHSIQSCKGNIHCSQKGQPYYAAVEGDGRIVLNHQLCITKSTDVVLVSYTVLLLYKSFSLKCCQAPWALGIF